MSTIADKVAEEFARLKREINGLKLDKEELQDALRDALETDWLSNGFISTDILEKYQELADPSE